MSEVLKLIAALWLLYVSIVLLALVLVTLLMSPARAAMEPEEIVVRLALGLPTTSVPPRVKTKKARHGRR